MLAISFQSLVSYQHGWVLLSFHDVCGVRVVRNARILTAHEFLDEYGRDLGDGDSPTAFDLWYNELDLCVYGELFVLKIEANELSRRHGRRLTQVRRICAEIRAEARSYSGPVSAKWLYSQTIDANTIAWVSILSMGVL